MIKKLTQPKQRKKIFRKWHRRIGLVISVFLANLAITGLMLNHYEALSLHKNTIQSSWLLDWYGIKSPQKIFCLESSNHKVCQVDTLVYRIDKNNIQLIGSDFRNIISLSSFNNELYLITNDNIVIFNSDFQLIESINTIEEISAVIIGTHAINNRLFLNTNGQLLGTTQTLELDLSTLDLLDISNEYLNIKFSVEPQTFLLANQELIAKLGITYRQKQITHLRFIQDLHSGQLFFFNGKLLTDSVAIAILLLIISGLSAWYRRKN